MIFLVSHLSSGLKLVHVLLTFSKISMLVFFNILNSVMKQLHHHCLHHKILLGNYISKSILERERQGSTLTVFQLPGAS